MLLHSEALQLGRCEVVGQGEEADQPRPGPSRRRLHRPRRAPGLARLDQQQHRCQRSQPLGRVGVPPWALRLQPVRFWSGELWASSRSRCWLDVVFVFDFVIFFLIPYHFTSCHEARLRYTFGNLNNSSRTSWRTCEYWLSLTSSLYRSSVSGVKFSRFVVFLGRSRYNPTLSLR